MHYFTAVKYVLRCHSPRGSACVQAAPAEKKITQTWQRYYLASDLTKVLQSECYIEVKEHSQLPAWPTPVWQKKCCSLSSDIWPSANWDWCDLWWGAAQDAPPCQRSESSSATDQRWQRHMLEHEPNRFSIKSSAVWNIKNWCRDNATWNRSIIIVSSLLPLLSF